MSSNSSATAQMILTGTTFIHRREYVLFPAAASLRYCISNTADAAKPVIRIERAPVDSCPAALDGAAKLMQSLSEIAAAPRFTAARDLSAALAGTAIVQPNETS